MSPLARQCRVCLGFFVGRSCPDCQKRSDAEYQRRKRRRQRLDKARRWSSWDKDGAKFWDESE